MNNLLIALATGLLAVAGQLLFSETVAPEVKSSRMLWTLALVGTSIVCGVGCALSRLLDVRYTARISRLRAPEDRTKKEGLRKRTRLLRLTTWDLLWLQLLTFASGAVAFATLVFARTKTPAADVPARPQPDGHGQNDGLPPE